MLYKINGYPHELWHTLLEKAKLCRAQGQKVIVLVPEQYTLDTERRLLKDMDLPGFFDMEVLSPTRLCSRVFSLSGSNARTHIDRSGRQMALARVLSERKDRLEYYRSCAENRGFIEKMGVLISQLKQGFLSSEQIRAHAETCEGATKHKYKDIAVIYEGYEQLTEGRFMDSADEMLEMMERIADSRLLDRAAVFVYGFDMMTEQLSHLTGMMAGCADQVYVLMVCMQGNELFGPVRKSMEKLQGESMDVLKCESDAAGDLRHLQKTFYSDYPDKYRGNEENITLSAMPNAYTELHAIAGKILELNHDGIPFEKMAVAMGTDQTALLSAVMKEYNIPVYISDKLPAGSHGVSVYLLSALHCLDGWKPEDVYDLLHSGYAPLTDTECFRFENYCLAYGIRGERFLHPLTRGDAEEITENELIRQKLLAPFEPLFHVFEQKEAPIRDALTAVYDFLTLSGAPDRLEENTRLLEVNGLTEKAIQTAQIWETLMQLLDQMDTIMEGMTCRAASLADHLEAGLQEKKLSSLPPETGCLNCGMIGNMPLNGLDVLFACALNDSMMDPAAPELLTDPERIALEEREKVHLSLSGREQDAMKQLDIWKAFSAPRKKLFLSYPTATQDGRALGKVSSINMILSQFPLEIQGSVKMRQGAQKPRSPQSALSALSVRLRENAPGDMTEEWQEAWAYLNRDENTRDEAEKLKSAFHEATTDDLPREIAKELFMERKVSISRLESFASCPFKHFADHGLKPVERKEWTFESNDLGNFYHDAMERFTRLLPEMQGWPRISKQVCDAAMDEAIRPLTEKLMRESPVGDYARLQNAMEKYKKAVKRVAWVFTRTSQNSAFRPDAQEIKFGKSDEDSLPALPLTLKDGSRIYLEGRIDRVDRYEGDEGLYLRVVDYKSSNKELKAGQIWWGLQLQLLLYMAVLLENEPQAQPAGMFYSHIDDPLLTEKEALKDIENALAAKLRLKGLGLKDVKVWRLMDNGDEPASLPRALNKDGEFSENAPAASLQEITAMIEHAKNKAIDLAEQIMAGHIHADPAAQKTSSPCDYCKHAALCRRDPSGKTRTVDKMSMKELFERLLTADENATAVMAESEN